MPLIHERLFPYQRQGVGFLIKPGHPHKILADQMGIGKSAQAIGACDAIRAQNILVICPGIARHNWREEFLQWSLHYRKIQVVEYVKAKLVGEVVIISYVLARSIPLLKQLLKRHWDVIIIDEAVAVKTPYTKRTKAIYGGKCDGKNGLVSVADRVWLLSGTLMPNHAGELWSHCNALFPDITKGMGHERWQQEYCEFMAGTSRIIGSKNQAKLVELMKPYVLRRLARDVLPQLPPLRLSYVPVHPFGLLPMSAEVSETAAVVKAAIATMDTESDPLKYRMMLADIDQGQIASLRRWTGLAKAPAVINYIKGELEGGLDRVVVFVWHRDVITMFEQDLPDAASLHGGLSPKRKQEILQEFQHGFGIRSLICNLEVASTAIPLFAANYVAFAEPPWVPAQIDQAVKRLHRQGQKRPVLAKLFALQGSFDETIVRTLVRKLRQTAAFNDAISTRMPQP